MPVAIEVQKQSPLKTIAHPPKQYPEITGQSVASFHEGAGFNYLFVVPQDQAAKFVYDEDAKTLYLDPEVANGLPSPYNFSIATGDTEFLTTSVIYKKTEVEIDDLGFLTFDGSSNVKAVKNVDEPYHYSKENYALVKYDSDAPEGAVSVLLQAVDA
ncbi:Cell wall protein PGA31 [Candida viswanathii]|uniref:Cell wall protein PGA31 n=1 Tax=Candida viswanathii TaxID=5486 RepID=A0A367XUU7_9ASCO|nr:Cell wall protein PGA31 [Candida viswanathii]